MFISNQAGRPLSTAHYVNTETTSTITKIFPSLIGSPQPGRLEAGQRATLLAPRGWAGNMAVGEARFGMPGGNSGLIEGSFLQQAPSNEWLFCMDVSYVAGYTVPMVCYCGNTTAPISGCRDPLFEKAFKCPAVDFEAAKGSCHNPKVNSADFSLAPFFAPCAAKAYSFPGDHDALASAKCQTKSLLCIIFPDNGLS